MRLFAGRMRGGLGVQTLLVAVVLAAMSGIIGGEIVLLGLLALPQMLLLGYDRRLAIGIVCAGGALGTMIPPSIVLIIYGLSANVSIGELFTASFVPGLMLGEPLRRLRAHDRILLAREGAGASAGGGRAAGAQARRCSRG